MGDSNSVLDFLSNNWQSILGVGANGPTMGGAAISGPQLPGPIAPATAPYSPSGAVDGNALTPQNGNPPADWTSMPNVAGNYGGHALTDLGPAPPPPAAPPGGAMAAPAPGGPPPQVPLPMPRPPMANGPGAPMSIAPPNPGAPGAPMSLAPPNPGAGAPPTNGGSLAQMLGAMPQRQPNLIGTGIAALGKGLSTVGGNTGAGAFARGMGGALTGGSQFQQQQQAQLFNQSSAAFKDMLAAKNQDDTEAYRRAQAAYLTSRAQAIQLGGSATGSGAWQNSPYGKTIQVENESQKYEKGQQIILQKQWALNGASPEQQQADLDKLQTRVDQYRGRLYKSAGIDPGDGKKMLNYGQSDSPFPTKGMTLDQFNQQVPMGAWYTDQNGTPRQRTVAPAGAGGGSEGTAQPSAPQSNGQQMQDYYDTGMAMQPSQ